MTRQEEVAYSGEAWSTDRDRGQQATKPQLGPAPWSQSRHRQGQRDQPLLLQPSTGLERRQWTHLRQKQHSSLPPPTELVWLSPGSHGFRRLTSSFCGSCTAPMEAVWLPLACCSFISSLKSSAAPGSALQFPPVLTEMAGGLLHVTLYSGLVVNYNCISIMKCK